MPPEFFVDTSAWYPLLVATHPDHVRTVGEAPNVVVHSTSKIEQSAERNWLARFGDRDFSLADAVSFAVMTERRIREVRTLEAHFAAAGFQSVP